MKKLLAIALLAGATAISHGQGYIGVANTSTTKISDGGPIGQPSAGSSYYFEILIAPTTVTNINQFDPLSGGWLDTTIMATNINSRANGLIQPMNNNVDDNGAQVPSSVMSFSSSAGTGTANFAVVGWSANLGPTLADALDAMEGVYDPGYTGGFPAFGVSSVALDIIGAPAGGPYNSIWGTVANGAIPGMNLALEIPEPSTFALCGLGAAITLILRRRKIQTNPMAQGAW